MNLGKLQVHSSNLFTTIKFIRKDRLHSISGEHLPTMTDICAQNGKPQDMTAV